VRAPRPLAETKGIEPLAAAPQRARMKRSHRRDDWARAQCVRPRSHSSADARISAWRHRRPHDARLV